MQTFVPYGDEFEANAYALDIPRLGKQRVEGYQILRANDAWRHGRKSGWQNHPATRMWRCHDAALIMYVTEMCDRWVTLGYTDTVAAKIRAEFPESCALVERHPEAAAMPDWLRDERVMLSHRSNLIRKDPDRYRLLWPDVPADLEYYWPK